MDVEKRLRRDAESFADEVLKFDDTAGFLAGVFVALGIPVRDDTSSASASPAGRREAAGRSGAGRRGGHESTSDQQEVTAPQTA